MSGDVHYEYRSDDRSLMLRGLRDVLFMRIVRVLPPALTPNHVTLLGHACMWASAIIALLAPSAGTGVLLALAFGYNAYNLSDTVDGLYARYSGRASRLGELFDHGLDPVSLGLVLLTYGIVMREPAWLILASAGTVAYLQFLTFLHGYRTGSVVLGEIGVIEGLTLATALCLAAALGAHPFLTSIVYGDMPVAGLVAVALLVGAIPALFSMRALVHRLGDLVPLLVIDAVIAAWFAFGRIGVPIAGVLIILATAHESMIVTSSRLRRLPLRLWDIPILALLCAALAASIALDLSAAVQTMLAAVASAYALARGAQLFFLTIASISRAPGAGATSFDHARVLQ